MNNSLSQQTYERIRKDIMTFSLKPGEPVSAAKLAERYQVSRTPAREALVRLHDDGMVDIYPKSKSVIAKINIRLARQEWFIRKTLELGMVDAFFENLTDIHIRKMQEHLDRQIYAANQERTHETSYSYLISDYDFHGITYQASGEQLAANVIANTVVHYARVRMLIDFESANQDRTVSDHKELIEFAKKRDREGYRKCLSRHIGYIIGDIENVGRQYPGLFEEI